MDNTHTCTSSFGNLYYSSDCSCNGYVTPDSNITDWSRPIAKCVAGDYSKMAVNGVIYNKQTLTNDMWVELPAYAKQFSVAGIYQIQPTPDCEGSVAICRVRQKNIWLRIPVDIMDTSVGQKIYRIEFKHRYSLENMSLYFSYTIQDDDPKKPYVYMK